MADARNAERKLCAARASRRMAGQASYADLIGSRGSPILFVRSSVVEYNDKREKSLTRHPGHSQNEEGDLAILSIAPLPASVKCAGGFSLFVPSLACPHRPQAKRAGAAAMEP